MENKTSENNFNFSYEPGREQTKRVSKYIDIKYITIITYLKTGNYINQLYQSIKNQTFPHFEWFVITNEKNDKLKEITKLDKRVKLVDSENKRYTECIYKCAELSNTELLLILEEEDLIDKTFIECAYFTMKTNPEATWAYSSMVNFGLENKLFNRKLTVEKMLTNNIISKCSIIRKKNFLEKKDYKDLPEEVHEDWYLWLYFFSQKYVPIKMDFYGYWHRKCKKEKSSTTDSDISQAKVSKEYINKIKSEINLNSTTIQFDKKYEVTFSDVPQKISLSTKDVFIDNNNKKSILLVMPWAIVGGADIFNLNLVKGLRKKGYNITIVSIKKSEYILRQEFEKYSDEFFDLTTFLKEKEWAGFMYYLMKTRKINSVIITNSFYGYYVLPWLKYHFKEVPFIDYIHAENWTLRHGGFPKDSNAVANYLDATYTCTRHLRDIMYNVMNRNVKNVKPVYIGTDTDWYNYNIEFDEDKILKEKYKGKKVILFISRMVHYKRPLFAIKLLQELLKTDNRYVLIMLGDGSAMTDVKKYIADNNLEDYVHIYGTINETRPFYKIANITLICSLREGLTLTTFESLSMGVPVVSGDIGGQKELITSEYGMLIKPYQKPEEEFNFEYSKDELTEYKEAVMKMISRKKYLKQKCRDRIVKNFSLRNMINKMDLNIKKHIASGSKVNNTLIDNLVFAERYLIINNMAENNLKK